MPQEKMYLEIKVQTSCRENSVEQSETGLYKVRVKAPPSKGEANHAVIKAIADYFNIPQSRVEIIRGHKNTRKLVSIEK